MGLALLRFALKFVWGERLPSNSMAGSRLENSEAML
jgi:hypothetical protein